jgi:hypothetical protein
MLEGFLHRSGLLPRLRSLWKTDVDSALKPARKDVRHGVQTKTSNGSWSRRKSARSAPIASLISSS